MDEHLPIFWNILQHSECQALCDLRLLALADTFAGEVGDLTRWSPLALEVMALMARSYELAASTKSARW